jgi:nucleoside-diphosphate-sugar epimerase
VLAVAKAAQRAGVRRVVLVSSIGVNGSATHGHPFTEADGPAPTEPYAVSKLEAEQALREALAAGATDWVVLRPPLVYGPGCPGNLAKLIGLAARAPVLPLGGLHAPRTLVAIDNLVDALLVAARHDAASRRTFVVADGRDIDVAGMLSAFLEGLGRGRWRLLSVPAGLLGGLAWAAGKSAAWVKISGALQVDAREFRKVTGWEPKIDPKDGLRAAAAAFSRTHDA